MESSNNPIIRVLNWLGSFFKSKTQTIWVLGENGAWSKMAVKNPISFSELDERFGKNGWYL
jgi:hypothetical protein